MKTKETVLAEITDMVLNEYPTEFIRGWLSAMAFAGVAEEWELSQAWREAIRLKLKN